MKRNLKLSKTFIIIVLLFIAAFPLYSDELPIDSSELVDIENQFAATSSGDSFTWYFQNAESKEVLETLSGVFEPEISENKLRLVNNSVNNSIMVNFKGEDYSRVYKEIIDLLKYLDKKNNEVLIEVLIAEIDVTNSKGIGLNWRYNSYNHNGKVGLDSKAEIDHAFLQDDADVNARILAENGLKFALGSADRMKGYIHGLITENKLNIISSPKIIAMNNHEAKISIGKTVPIITGTTISDNNKVTNVYSDFEAKMELIVTPRISRSGRIYLDISQSLDELGDYDVKNRVATKTRRLIQTTLSLADNQTVVLGGFIKETNDKKKETIPWLKKMPIVNKFIGDDKNSKERRELMVFITPKIIQSKEKGDYVTQKMKGEFEIGKSIEEHLKMMKKIEPSPLPDEVMLIKKATDGWCDIVGNKYVDDVIKEIPNKIDDWKIYTKRMVKFMPKRRSPFGYGRVKIKECMYNTVIKSNKNYVFVREFNIKNKRDFKKLELRVASDNAAVCYLNGKLIDLDSQIMTKSGHDLEYWNRFVDVDSKFLKNGKNYMVAILKNEKNSVEAFFDLELRGVLFDKNRKNIEKKNLNRITENYKISRHFSDLSSRLESIGKISKLKKTGLKIPKFLKNELF